MKKCKYMMIALVCCLMLGLGAGVGAAFEYDVTMDDELAKFVAGTKARHWNKATIDQSFIMYDEVLQTFSINERRMYFLNQDAGDDCAFGKLEVLDGENVIDNLAFIEQVVNGRIGDVYKITYWEHSNMPGRVFVSKINLK